MASPDFWRVVKVRGLHKYEIVSTEAIFDPEDGGPAPIPYTFNTDSFPFHTATMLCGLLNAAKINPQQQMEMDHRDNVGLCAYCMSDKHRSISHVDD